MRAITLQTPRLTIAQIMKLVVYCAVACACVAPMMRLVKVSGGLHGPVGPTGIVGLWAAITVPLVWAGVSFLMIRPGRVRDQIILAFLIIPVGMMLGLGTWMLSQHAMVFRGWRTRPIHSLAVDFGGVVVHFGILLMLGMALVFLAGRLAKGHRPILGVGDKA